MRRIILVRAGWPLFVLAALTGQTLPLTDILSRVSEEAEVFRRVAPQTISEEALGQRSLKPPPRFRPRVGAGATAAAPPPEYRTRTIVSEYSYSTLQDAPGALHEFRQVISVDGRSIKTPEQARHALSLGLKSE